MAVDFIKHLKCWDLIFIGLGSMIGSGAFVLIGKIAQYSGYFSWLSIVLAGSIIYWFSKSYIQISQTHQTNNAEYVTLKEQFGPLPATIVSYINILSICFICVAVAISFGGYLSTVLPFISPHVGTLLCIGLGTLCNVIGIEHVSFINQSTTLLGFLGLLVFFGIGLYNAPSKFTKTFHSIKQEVANFNVQTIKGILMGMFIIFFAFFGFETITKMYHESVNPLRDIPMALKVSIGITIVLYGLLSIVSLLFVNKKQLASSDAPLNEVIKTLTTNKVIIGLISISAISLTFNTLMLMITTASRLYEELDSKSAQESSQESSQEHVPVKLILILGAIITLLYFLGFNILSSTILGNLGIIVMMIMIKLSTTQKH